MSAAGAHVSATGTSCSRLRSRAMASTSMTSVGVRTSLSVTSATARLVRHIMRGRNEMFASARPEREFASRAVLRPRWPERLSGWEARPVPLRAQARIVVSCEASEGTGEGFLRFCKTRHPRARLHQNETYFTVHSSVEIAI